MLRAEFSKGIILICKILFRVLFLLKRCRGLGISIALKKWLITQNIEILILEGLFFLLMLLLARFVLTAIILGPHILVLYLKVFIGAFAVSLAKTFPVFFGCGLKAYLL